MKTKEKTFGVLLAFAIITAVCVSCTTVKEIELPYTVETVLQEEAVVDITIKPIYVESKVSGSTSAGEMGTRGFLLTLKNISDEAVLIDWSKSSIAYGSTSSSIGQEGQKYKDANTPMPPLVLPVGNTQERYIFAANQIAYEKNGWTGKYEWVVKPIPLMDMIVTICATTSTGEGAGDHYYMLHIMQGEKDESALAADGVVLPQDSESLDTAESNDGEDASEDEENDEGEEEQ